MNVLFLNHSRVLTTCYTIEPGKEILYHQGIRKAYEVFTIRITFVRFPKIANNGRLWLCLTIVQCYTFESSLCWGGEGGRLLVMVANPFCGQLNRENIIIFVPGRGLGSAVSRLASSFSYSTLWAYSPYSCFTIRLRL